MYALQLISLESSLYVICNNQFFGSYELVEIIIYGGAYKSYLVYFSNLYIM